MPVSTASADTMIVTGPQDFYFSFDEPTLITFRTYAQEYGIDSMLWFYDDQDNLLVANDDWFGLDSYLQYEVQPGIMYRLRTGVCCGNPNAWYGTSYRVEGNGSLITTPEPTTTTTTTEVPTTTTTEPEQTTTTTIVEEATTTTVVEETTTTVEETTTTTTEPAPTTTVPEETWPPTTESTPPTTTPTTTAPPVTVPVVNPPEETGPPEATIPQEPEETTPPTSPDSVAPPPATATDGDVPASNVDAPSAGTDDPVQPDQPSEPESPVDPETPSEPDTPTEPESPAEPDTPEESTPEPEVPSVEDALAAIESGNASNDQLVAVLESISFDEISTEDAEAIIEAIDFNNLTDEQTEQVVAALNQAPDAVKQTFENKVNVYSGQFDSYVPSGSVVTVGQRRVIVAVSAATMIAPAAAGSSRKRN